MVGPIVSVEVRGAEQLRALGVKLRVAGTEGKVLRRELLTSMRAAAAPLAKETAPQAARDELPKAGGLNEYVANAGFTVRNRLTGFNAGVRITSRGRHRFKVLDQGRAVHPVFGNRERWAANPVKAGWFSKSLADKKPQVQIAVFAAMQRVARQIKE